MRAASNQTIETIKVADVYVSDTRRPVDEAAVARLMNSIERLGLQTPISVRFVDNFDIPGEGVTDGVPILIAGRHRLEAVKRLGWERIPAIDTKADDIEARLWEISENLHRAELSPAERAEQIEEWRTLTLHTYKQQVRNNSAPLGGAQPDEKGYRKTAGALGISEKSVRNAELIASLPQEVRDQARAEDWTQRRLLDVAKPRQVKIAADPLHDMEALEAQVARLMTAWNAASPEARAEFLLRIDTPVFDNTKAA